MKISNNYYYARIIVKNAEKMIKCICDDKEGLNFVKEGGPCSA